jgi:mono/diheme cytochrome c family protein
MAATLPPTRRLVGWLVVVAALVGCTPLLASTPPAADGDAVARGARLFRGQGCAGCHAIGGEGGQTGPDLTIIGTIAATRRPDGDARRFLRQAIVEVDADVTPGYPAGVMPRTYGQVLRSEQIDDLVAFLLAQHAD